MYGMPTEKDRLNEVRNMYLAFMRENIVRMGLQDREVRVVMHLTYEYRFEHRTNPSSVFEWHGTLSEALAYEVCLHWQMLLDEENDDRPPITNTDIWVFVGDELLGQLGSGTFHFACTVPLREALGWLVVANWNYPPFSFDMEGALEQLYSVVKQGTSEELFHGPWQDALKAVFVWKDGMCCRDAYRGSECYLWRAAHIDVSRVPHDGYRHLIREPRYKYPLR